VKLDPRLSEQDTRAQVVLVTGGAGSIGSELARQIAHLGPAASSCSIRREPLYYTHLR
jgi:FlaA1/EpsC-like NDP-sugar epimerase